MKSKGTGRDARGVSEARLFTLATTWEEVESLVSIPVLTSHAMISAEQRGMNGRDRADGAAFGGDEVLRI